MPLKRRRKPNAEFSVASLTDIIFLLLIFFMLNSELVSIKPFDLPKSDSKTVAPVNLVVSIEKNGNHTLNNVEISPRALEQGLRQKIIGLPPEELRQLTVTIVAETGTPFDYVTDVMEIAARLKARAIIATQPKS